MSCYRIRTLPVSFDEAARRTIEAFKSAGFGVLTAIDDSRPRTLQLEDKILLRRKNDHRHALSSDTRSRLIDRSSVSRAFDRPAACSLMHPETAIRYDLKTPSASAAATQDRAINSIRVLSSRTSLTASRKFATVDSTSRFARSDNVLNSSRMVWQGSARATSTEARNATTKPQKTNRARRISTLKRF
jgi:hypothetical protein